MIPSAASRRLAAAYAMSLLFLAAASSRAAPAATQPGDVQAPDLANWAKNDGGIDFTLADGRKVALTVRSPLAVRLSWTPPRANKPEDWLIVPSASPERGFTATEQDGQVVLATSKLRIVTPRRQLALRA